MSLTSFLDRLAASCGNKFFYFPENFRVRLTKAAIAGRHTQMLRWKDIGREKDAAAWVERSEYAARWLTDCNSVIDLGCGTMPLEKFLPPGTLYIPVDVAKRDGRTIVVDLNKERLPELQADAIVALGLIGYLFDVPGLLNFLAERYRTVVVSYNATDTADAAINRLANGWVNAYSSTELETIFRGAGLIIQDKRRLGTQLLWKLSGAPNDPQ